MAAGRGGSGLDGACCKQRGFLLVSVASAQLLFFPDCHQKCLSISCSHWPQQNRFFVWLQTLWMQLKKKKDQQATLHFYLISDIVCRLSVSPGSQTPCKYDYGKYFTCIACGPLHKTLRDQRPRLTWQTGSAAFPGDCSNRAKCYCRPVLSQWGTKHFGQLSEPTSHIQLWMGNVCFDRNSWNNLVYFF